MENKILSLLKRFITNEHLEVHELKLVRDWIDNPENIKILDKWMKPQWEHAPEIESETSFKELITQIDKHYQLRKTTTIWDLKFVQQFQKIAAILILPIILLSAYYFLVVQNSNTQYSEAIVPHGQKSEIVLPDGTHIWLNSGTNMRYPLTFGAENREIFLDGEAYFEVTKNKHKPFIVNTSNLSVTVLGTKFNVKAYADESEIETALLSGHINLIVNTNAEHGKIIEMNPGELISYSKENNSVGKSGFRKDEVVGWKNNRLVFHDDTFNNLVRKIERWYNVVIIYDKTLFEDQRLTVDLLEGESIERLFQIIESAINVDCRINKQKIYINPKMKNLKTENG